MHSAHLKRVSYEFVALLYKQYRIPGIQVPVLHNPCTTTVVDTSPTVGGADVTCFALTRRQPIPYCCARSRRTSLQASKQSLRKGMRLALHSRARLALQRRRLVIRTYILVFPKRLPVGTSTRDEPDDSDMEYDFRCSASQHEFHLAAVLVHVQLSRIYSERIEARTGRAGNSSHASATKRRRAFKGSLVDCMLSSPTSLSWLRQVRMRRSESQIVVKGAPNHNPPENNGTPFTHKSSANFDSCIVHEKQLQCW